MQDLPENGYKNNSHKTSLPAVVVIPIDGVLAAGRTPDMSLVASQVIYGDLGAVTHVSFRCTAGRTWN